MTPSDNLTPKERRAKQAWREYYDRQCRKRHGISEPVPAYARVLAWVIVVTIIALLGVFYPVLGVLGAIGAALTLCQERAERRAYKDWMARSAETELRRRP
jgi:hypothetical protein